MLSLEQLNQRLAQEIPLSRALQLVASQYQNDTLTVSAPLAPNLNHKQTAFGGSLYCVAVLTGWALVNLRIEQEDPDLYRHTEVVIYHSEMSYQQAVNGDFEARATSSAKLKSQTFLKQLRRHGKASNTECIEILQNDTVKARLLAKYVAIRTA